jgi:predicted nucleotidyltransferase
MGRRLGYDCAMTTLPDKLGAIIDATSVFGEHGVKHALIGGLAVGIRSGVPRATLDVDFAIPTSVDRTWLAAKLQQHGFQAGGSFAHSINFTHASGEPVQLAFDAAFDPMIERAEPLRLHDVVLYVVTLDDLIAMKRRAAADPARRRSKALRDQADIALLEGDVPDPDEGW